MELSHAVRRAGRGAAPIFLLGQAVRVLHDLDPRDLNLQGTSADLPVEPWSVPLLARTELESTLGAGQCLTALMPAVGARFRRLAMEVVDRLEELPAEDLRIGYGDLKCDNIIAADDRIWLLDLDRTGLRAVEPKPVIRAFTLAVLELGLRHGGAEIHVP